MYVSFGLSCFFSCMFNILNLVSRSFSTFPFVLLFSFHFFPICFSLFSAGTGGVCADLLLQRFSVLVQQLGRQHFSRFCYRCGAYTMFEKNPYLPFL